MRRDELAVRKVTAEEMIAELSGKWCWENVYKKFCARLSDFNLKPTSLFTILRVHDPKGRNQVGQGYFAWWPAEVVQEQHQVLQRWYDHRAGVIPRQPFDSKGEETTAELLFECRENPEKTAATLLAAALFERVGSSRGTYRHEEWPPFVAVSALYRMACEKMGFPGYPAPWHMACTRVLPWGMYGRDHSPIDSFAKLLHFLGEEVASVLLKNRLVVVAFAESPDPEIAAILQPQYEEERKQREKRDEEYAARQAEERAVNERRRQAHPRYGEWQSLPAKELERMVWTMPSTQVADLFGVSDVAVAKRCKSSGIAKPPLGFWAKVAAGRQPHPNGKPQDTPAKQPGRRGAKTPVDK